MRLDVVYEPTATGWSAYPAEVSGVGVTAPDREAARVRVLEAASSHLDIPRAELELREYEVITERTGNSYKAYLSPHVLGCWAEAATADDAQDMLAAAIQNGCLRVETANLTFYSSAAFATHIQQRVPA
jgi:hypothetical protein